MMGQRRTNNAVNAAQSENGTKCRERSDSAARKRNGMELETLRFDRFGAIDDARRDVYFVAGIAGRASHREAVRQEIPIFRNDIKEATGACGVHLEAQRLCHA